MSEILTQCEACGHFRNKGDRFNPECDDCCVWAEEEMAHLTARAEAAEAAKWQPIETAPKDGTKILVTGKTRKGQFYYVAKCRKYEHAGGHDWIDDGGACYERELITHWQPLPAPPKESKGE